MTSYLVLLGLINKVLLTGEPITYAAPKLQYKMPLSLNSGFLFLKLKMISSLLKWITPGHS